MGNTAGIDLQENSGGSSGGGGSVNGSANAYGSMRVGAAKLQGDWRAHAGRSLVGELGREIIVDPNTGRWYTVGDIGPGYIILKSSTSGSSKRFKITVDDSGALNVAEVTT